MEMVEKKEKLVIEHVSKSYQKIVLDDISFKVYEGEFLSILGSSGCGKTTLLRGLIGLEEFDGGTIYIDSKDVTKLTAFEKKMGIVFQNYALFPNMTVEKNISYALKCKKLPKDKIKEKVNSILEATSLLEHKDKYPRELSGGQQQRVAIARTLVLNCDIILFDEPMSALDAITRSNIRKFILEIQKKYGITIIYITHDQEEAFSMSDRVLVMNDGKIEQMDTPYEIYNNPKTDFVKNFVVDELNEKVKSILESVKKC